MPTRIPGCVLWLRADMGITLNGSTVSAWADQSGNGNNATQATGSAQPTYKTSDAGYGGHPTLSFASASSQQLALSHLFPAQPFTAYVVGESTSGAAQQEFFGDSANNVCIFRATDWSIFAGTSLASSNTTQGTAQAFGGVFNTTNSALYIDSSTSAAASGNIGNFNPTSFQFIGSQGANNLNGKIAEVIVYSGAHSQAQVAQLFRYFASRYGGAWS